MQGINRLCFSHVEKYQFGSVSEDGCVCVWSVESQRLLNKYSSPHTGKLLRGQCCSLLHTSNLWELLFSLVFQGQWQRMVLC